MKILVAGGGAFGTEHLKRLSAMGGLELAVAEPRAEQRDRIVATFPIAMVDADAIGLLDRFRPDGVVIATPAATHAPLALAALSRDIPILVEKPVAPNSDTMHRLCEAAERSRAFLQPGHILRFSAPHRLLQDVVHEGQIGRLLGLASRRYRDAGHAELYRDVDPVFTTMIHDIDLALWFDTGRVPQMRASRQPRDDYRALTTASATSSAGVHWHLSMAWLHPTLECPPDRIELVGTDGSVEFEVGRGIDLFTRQGHRHLAEDDTDDPLRTELEAFLSGIRAGSLRAPVAPEDALEGLLVAERIVTALAG